MICSENFFNYTVQIRFFSVISGFILHLLKINLNFLIVGEIKIFKILAQRGISKKSSMFFVFSYLVAATSVNRVYTHIYYNIYNQGSRHKKSLSHWWGSATENQWFATNFSGEHLSLTYGHSHLCAYKVSVSATCGRHK